MDEESLARKLRAIETLFLGTTVPGEQQAARDAASRILDRLEEIRQLDPPIEFQFSMSDPWSRKLFMALLRRYGINPYRYSRQRHTTVMASVSKSFLDQTLWPEFQELNKILRAYLSDVTDRVIKDALHADSSEAQVCQSPKQIAAT